MSSCRAIVLSAASLLLSCASLTQAAEPTRQWRPATEAEIAALQANAEAEAAANPTPAALPAPTDPDAAPAQRAFIDPATGEQVSAPVVSPQPETSGAETPAPDFRLQRSPEGYLYIDTTGYQHFETATLKADGSVRIDCNIPGHSHAADTPPADPAANAPAANEQEPRQ